MFIVSHYNIIVKFQVYIGTNLCYDVGILKYVQDAKIELQQVYIIGLTIAGIVLLGLFIIFIIICFYIIMKSSKKKAKQLVEHKEFKMVEKYNKETHHWCDQ